MTQEQALDEWWFNLNDEGRRLALAVPGDEPMSEQAARSLRRYGVRVPEVALARDVPGLAEAAVLYPQPPEITSYLDRWRSTLQRSPRRNDQPAVFDRGPAGSWFEESN